MSLSTTSPSAKTKHCIHQLVVLARTFKPTAIRKRCQEQSPSHECCIVRLKIRQRKLQCVKTRIKSVKDNAFYNFGLIEVKGSIAPLKPGQAQTRVRAQLEQGPASRQGLSPEGSSPRAAREKHWTLWSLSMYSMSRIPACQYTQWYSILTSTRWICGHASKQE